MDKLFDSVLVTGIPKSGTNATQRAVTLLGLKSHREHMADVQGSLASYKKIVYVYRNPRNVLISAVRYHNAQVRGADDSITEEKIRSKFFNFFNSVMPCTYKYYNRWLDVTTVHHVRFEDLIADDNALRDMAAYLGVDYNNSWPMLPGNTGTWTGQLSDWKEHWTPAIGEMWKSEGMQEIEEGLGYLNDVGYHL